VPALPPSSRSSGRNAGRPAVHHPQRRRRPALQLLQPGLGARLQERRPGRPAADAHDCRSTFGSWLISEGIGLEAVQDQLGHESYETTRKIYAHLLPAVGVAAGKAASAALWPSPALCASVHSTSDIPANYMT
jgi:integrase